MLTRADWQERYRQQAAWTAGVREYLFRQINLPGMSRILETGCGGGAITAAIHGYAQGTVAGIDLDLPMLALARQADPLTGFAGADAARLPFASGVFDCVLCHFFLLWVDRPTAVLAEMVRVIRPGGVLLALAEPDYGGRIDYPEQLADLGQMQASALAEQGADQRMGRKLGGLLSGAGLEQIQTGVTGGQWNAAPPAEGWQSEWAVLENDLAGRIPPDELAALREIDRAAWARGARVLFVPTFYAWGRKNPG